MAKKAQTPKPVGVNEGLNEGMKPEDFKGRVICKKCGKDIEYTLGSELFLKCPRCKAVLERDLEKENEASVKIVKFDLLRRSQKYVLQIGLALVIMSLIYNIVGFFLGWFLDNRWWLALLSLPFIALSYICVRVAMKKCETRKCKIAAWVAIVLCCLAVAAAVVTAVPYINELVFPFQQLGV